MVAKRLAKDVKSRHELVEYISALAESVRAGEVAVENDTTADLLGAAAAWIRDYDGYFMNQDKQVPEVPDWSLIAAIFSAALVYE
jgi:hypothetical protein